MKWVVSGGTGFIGRRLVDRLVARSDYVGVYSRRPGKETRTAVQSYKWHPLSESPPPDSLNNYDAVIHLAGEPVAQRWNEDVKRRIRDSRVLGTRRLVDVMAKVQHKPRVLVCASAVGYYGNRGDEILTENSSVGTGFLADVSQAWEAEADRAAALGVRVVKIRIGIVLGADGGAMARMLPPFRAGAGGRLGSGRQWMPWVHVDDVVSLFMHAAENDISGVWNAVSPHPVTNAKFTEALASAVHRPALLPVPLFALKLAFGELGKYLLDSARVLPEAAGRAGFQFRYPELDVGLKNLLG